MNFVSRLLTIIVTATLTSAAWIVFGSSLFEKDGVLARTDVEAEDAARDSRQDSDAPVSAPENPDAEPTPQSTPLDREATVQPDRRETANLVVPVLNVSASELTDSFTDEADSDQLHEALDIPAREGTTVVAAALGTIEKLYKSDSGGNTIYVRSEDGKTIHYYAHLARYAEGLREGQKVRRGQRLGEVGSTGNADPASPHLHFAIFRTLPDAQWWEPATAINPYPLFVKE